MSNPSLFHESTITDVCILVEDIDRSLHFYRDVIGLQLRRRAPGFADFKTAGVTLALWERRHMTEHVGIEILSRSDAARACISALEVESPERVDTICDELTQRGVVFLKPPTWYVWNAYACYFEDPDHHLWEIYAWGVEGHAGLIE